MTSGIATVTSKGQLTVPANIREALKLRAGDKVEFMIHGDGTVRFLAINRPLESLFGCIPYDGPTKTLDEIEEGIAEGAAHGEGNDAGSSIGKAA